MIKSVEKPKPQPLVASFNSTHDYVTFAVLICLIIGGLTALYVYNQKTQLFGVWAKEFYSALLN